VCNRGARRRPRDGDGHVDFSRSGRTRAENRRRMRDAEPAHQCLQWQQAGRACRLPSAGLWRCDLMRRDGVSMRQPGAASRRCARPCDTRSRRPRGAGHSRVLTAARHAGGDVGTAACCARGTGRSVRCDTASRAGCASRAALAACITRALEVPVRAGMFGTYRGVPPVSVPTPSPCLLLQRLPSRRSLGEVTSSGRG